VRLILSGEASTYTSSVCIPKNIRRKEAWLLKRGTGWVHDRCHSYLELTETKFSKIIFHVSSMKQDISCLTSDWKRKAYAGCFILLFCKQTFWRMTWCLKEAVCGELCKITFKRTYNFGGEFGVRQRKVYVTEVATPILELKLNVKLPPYLINNEFRCSCTRSWICY
jgi:hypothetical protein